MMLETHACVECGAIVRSDLGQKHAESHNRTKALEDQLKALAAYKPCPACSVLYLPSKADHPALHAQLGAMAKRLEKLEQAFPDMEVQQ